MVGNHPSPLRWLLLSQNLILFGSSMVFPFYVIFIKEVGASFTQFGLAYGLFAMSSALAHAFAGHLADRFGTSIWLALSAWGTAVALVFFPVVTMLYQVYILQVIMGLFGAFQKTAEKTLVADLTPTARRGRHIGRYHAWTTLCSGLAVMVAGYTVDVLTLDVIFYAGSLCLFISGLCALKIREPQKV